MPRFVEPLSILPGVEPSTDRVGTTTRYYTFTKGIRFRENYPEKVGGWSSLTLNEGEEIGGVARSIFSYELTGLSRYLIGTNTRLYDLTGSAVVNITPLKIATIAVPNSLATYFDTLANDPIATTIGSSTITVTDTAHKFQPGDIVTLSGSTAVNGIPATDINNDQFVRSVTTDTYDIIVNTTATSTGPGGGAAVVRSSGYITVTSAAHGQASGDRVAITGAADTGGILAAEINLEFEIRNVTTNTFDIYTAGTATSSVTGGGGAGTQYQEQIDAGPVDTLVGQGYGVGLYGVGLYGVSGTSSSTTHARVWSHDVFGNLTVSCSGSDGGVYQWDGDTQVAPTLVPNAPTGNYVFVSDSILVILGYDNIADEPNDSGITWSDQGSLSVFDAGQAGSDVIEGAGRFISHASARGENLLFTNNQVYSFRYVGGQFIWETRLLDGNIGLIGQSARVAADGNIYWMSNNNFYMWRGGGVEVIPANGSPECTCRDFVFEDINTGQSEKIFAWFNPEFREVWWHYPAAASNEPDRIVRLNIDTFVWVIDELERTAAEYPSIININPYLIDQSSVVYLHEDGVNDDGAPLDWQLNGPFYFSGDDLIMLHAYIPDYTLTGTVTTEIEFREYPRSTALDTIVTTLMDSNADARIALDTPARYIQYRLSGNELDQQFKIGTWYQEVDRSTPRA